MELFSSSAHIYLLCSAQLKTTEVSPFLPWLSSSETLRYGSITRPERRRQFLLGRLLLRHALGNLLGLPATEMALIERSGNAPDLAFPIQPNIGLSISHSGVWIACAVSATVKLGLDIERINVSRDLDALAAQVFDDDALSAWRALSESHRVHDFYRRWTYGEALYKLQCPRAARYTLPHSELAITLCASAPLTQPPTFNLITFHADGLRSV